MSLCDGHAAIVSILAPRCRGPRPYGRAEAYRRQTFQSSPLVAEGRELVCPSSVPPALHVSILAPRCRGARPALMRARLMLRCFKSSPLVAEGRDQAVTSAGCGSTRFQSSPLVAEGRDLDRGGKDCGSLLFQSSPSLFAQGRDSPRPVYYNGIDDLFQSSPLVAEGRDRLAAIAAQQSRCVSILAPRCRGARRSAEARARPVGLKFQSSPLVAEGRDAGAAGRKSGHGWSFNPRPSLPRGATHHDQRADALLIVSILAPRCRGARRNSTKYGPRGTWRFNPRPSLPRGATPA